MGFSVLRILFAVGMLTVLLPSFADRRCLWGQGSWWIAPAADDYGWWDPLRAIFPFDNALAFDIAYAALIALVLLFMVGWKTRWITPLLLFGWVALSTNNPLLTNGGDTLMRIVLLFGVFADLSRHASVDAWLARRRERAGIAPRRPWVAPWLRASMHNTALILSCYQMILVYLVSSVYKLQGSEWLDGTALYYALSLTEFQVLPGLSEMMREVTPFVMLATWLTVGVQLAFPIMLLWKPTRYAAVVLVTITHLGIAVLLGLWAFSLTMIAIDFLFVRDQTWERLRALIARGRTISRSLAAGLDSGNTDATSAPPRRLAA